MPLAAISNFVPSSPDVPYILEDTHLKGGYRVFKTIADRDDWTAKADKKSFNGLIDIIDARKVGQLAYVIEDDTIYKLLEDKLTWEELKFGADYQVETPLQVIGDNRLSIDPDRIIPVPGEPGQVLGLSAEGKPIWVDMVSSSGTRGVVEYTAPEPIESGAEHEFSIPDVGKSIMLIKMELNATDIRIEGFGSSKREDKNPYMFVSDVNLLFDEGIRVDSEGEYERFRRHSFLSNLDNPVTRTHYFKFTNIGDAPATPTMKLTYLVLE